jgi:hypothetical protein
VVDNPNGVCRGIVRATTDDREIAIADCGIPLVDDGISHYARITLG